MSRNASIAPTLALLLLALVAVFVVVDQAAATHFRYGQLSWRSRQDLGPRTVEFTLVAAFRRNGYNGSHPDGLPDIGDNVLETIGGTSLDFGDGASTARLYVRVAAIDVRQNWIYGFLHEAPGDGLSTIRHIYGSDGNRTARTSTCCRISPCVASGGTGGLGNRHVNNPDGNYRLETIVNVGTTNRPPTSTLFPIIGCRRDEVCSFRIPTEDLDGDTVRFRLSTANEAAGGSFRQPGDAGSGAPNPVSVSPEGIFSWDTTGATGSGMPQCPRVLYSTQVMMEDVDLQGNVKSKIPLDFFLLLGGSGNPPVFVGNSPCDQTVFGTTSELLTFNVQALDPDSEDEVSLNVVGLPFGATTDPPLPMTVAPGQTISTTFRWNAINSQVGRFVLYFAASDRTNQTLCPITLEISSCSDDRFGDPQIVSFDADETGLAIPPLVDVSGTALQNQGIVAQAFSGVNGNPGLYTNVTGAPGTDTDDLIPRSNPNFITTLANTANPADSDWGTAIFDFVDPISHLPRPVELAELFFLDVEDSVGRLSAFDGMGATGTLVDVKTTSNNLSGSTVRLEVGQRLSDFRILSIQADFGDSSDSAALDHLCYEFARSRVTIDDGVEPETVMPFLPGEEIALDLRVANETTSTYRGTFFVFAITSPDDPARRRLRTLRLREFAIRPERDVQKTVRYSLPASFGSAGDRILLGHYVCTRDMVVESGDTVMLEVAAP